MPNEKKYKTAKALENAINKYLRSIRTKRELNELSEDGKPITVVEYIVPPEIGDIVHELKISHQTWWRYISGKCGDDYQAVCQAAKDECKRWCMRELLTRTKSLDGIEFNLRVNYGLNDKQLPAPEAPPVRVTIGDESLAE